MLVKHYVDSNQGRSIRLSEVEGVDIFAEQFKKYDPESGVMQVGQHVVVTVFAPDDRWTVNLHPSWDLDDVELYLNETLGRSYVVDLSFMQNEAGVFELEEDADEDDYDDDYDDDDGYYYE